MAAVIKKAYNLFYSCQIEEQDKSWARHILQHLRNKSLKVVEWLKTGYAFGSPSNLERAQYQQLLLLHVPSSLERYSHKIRIVKYPTISSAVHPVSCS